MRFFLLILWFGIACADTLDPERAAVIDRIRPLGVVDVEGQDHPTAETHPVLKVEARSGEAVYQQYCHVCHQSGVAGAPLSHRPELWKKRIEEKKLPGLLAAVTNGYKAMPPMGTCQDCTQAELKAAIQYMMAPE